VIAKAEPAKMTSAKKRISQILTFHLLKLGRDDGAGCAVFALILVNLLGAAHSEQHRQAANATRQVVRNSDNEEAASEPRPSGSGKKGWLRASRGKDKLK
jgi:hypothetical protein